MEPTDIVSVKVETVKNIELNGKKGEVKVTFEIPIFPRQFNNESEMRDWLEAVNLELLQKGITVNSCKEALEQLAKMSFNPLALVLADYLWVTSISGMGGYTALDLLMDHIRQAAQESLVICMEDTTERENQR